MLKTRIPPEEWAEFLRKFSLEHRHWVVVLETHDVDTDETVVSRETPLQAIDYDLEDQKNPRINVTVKSDNKVIKHILFKPSELSFYRSDKGDEALRIRSVNTATVVRFRKPGQQAA